MPLSPVQLELIQPLGVLYAWGAGDLKHAPTTWPTGAQGIKGFGYECSGYAQGASWAIGALKLGVWVDQRAVDLANCCDPVAVLDAQPGDLVFYGRTREGKPAVSHVMVIFQAAFASRPAMVIGATGGGSTTHGNNPKACVKIEPIGYRNDFVTCGRFKAQYRP